MIKLPVAVTTNKLQFGLARALASGNVTVTEVYFYYYDELMDEIMGLYMDDLHTVLRPEVTQGTIDLIFKQKTCKVKKSKQKKRRGEQRRALTELVAYRPMRNKNASRLFLMIAAMGVDLMLTYLCVNIFSTNVRPLSVPFLSGVIKLGGVSIAKLDLCSATVAVILLALLWTLLQKSKYGVADRKSVV